MSPSPITVSPKALSPSRLLTEGDLKQTAQHIASSLYPLCLEVHEQNARTGAYERGQLPWSPYPRAQTVTLEFGEIDGTVLGVHSSLIQAAAKSQNLAVSRLVGQDSYIPRELQAYLSLSPLRSALYSCLGRGLNPRKVKNYLPFLVEKKLLQIFKAHFQEKKSYQVRTRVSVKHFDKPSFYYDIYGKKHKEEWYDHSGLQLKVKFVKLKRPPDASSS